MKKMLYIGGTIAFFLVTGSIAFSYQKMPRQSTTPKTKTGQAAAPKTKTDKDPVAYAKWLKAKEPMENVWRSAEDNYRSGNFVEAEKMARQTIEMAAGLTPLPQARARKLLGLIRMKQGRYREALGHFNVDWQSNKDAGMDLDVALCFVRLGNYDAARRFYSDNAALRFDTRLTAKDLPGTRTPKALEASILFAKAQNAAITSDGEQEAAENYLAVSRLLPENGIYAYYTGRALESIKRHSEAIPYYRTAIRRLDSRSKLMEDAKYHEQSAVYINRVQQEAKAAGVKL